MRRRLQAGRLWLAALSFLAVTAVGLFMFASSPVSVYAAGRATESSNGMLAVEGRVVEGGKPLAGVWVYVKIPVKVHGKWVYRLLGKAKTNSGGKFDVVVDHAPPHTYFVAFVEGKGIPPIKKYILIKPKEQVAFALSVTTGFTVAGVQTFVY